MSYIYDGDVCAVRVVSTATCVYNGKAYNQGQTWDDGCSYTCVCVDELNGKYMCSEK